MRADDWNEVATKPVPKDKKGRVILWYHPPIYHPTRGKTHGAHYRVDTMNLPSRPATHWQWVVPPAEGT